MFDEEIQLLGRVDAGVAVMDAAGIVVRWNDHAERILGVKAADAVGKPWRELLLVLGSGSLAGSEVRKAALHPGGWHGLTSLQLDGKVVRVEAHVQSLKLAPDDDRPGIAAIFWAVPAEDAAPAVETLPYRDLFRHSPEALLLSDMEGLVVDANEAAARMFGRARERMVGLQMETLMEDWTEADGETARAELAEAGSIVRTVSIQVNSESQAHETLVAEAICTMASPTHDGYAMVRLRDVTNLRQNERMLRELAAIARLEDEETEVAVRRPEGDRHRDRNPRRGGRPHGPLRWRRRAPLRQSRHR